MYSSDGSLTITPQMDGIDFTSNPANTPIPVLFNIKTWNNATKVAKGDAYAYGVDKTLKDNGATALDVVVNIRFPPGIQFDPPHANYWVIAILIPNGTYWAATPPIGPIFDFVCQQYHDDVTNKWYWDMVGGYCVNEQFDILVTGYPWTEYNVGTEVYVWLKCITTSDDFGKLPPTSMVCTIETGNAWPASYQKSTANGVIETNFRLAVIDNVNVIHQKHWGTVVADSGNNANTANLAECQDILQQDLTFLTRKPGTLGGIEECKLRKVVTCIHNGQVITNYIDVPDTDQFVNHAYPTGIQQYGKLTANGPQGAPVSLSQKCYKNTWQNGVWIKEEDQDDNVIDLSGFQGLQGLQATSNYLARILTYDPVTYAATADIYRNGYPAGVTEGSQGINLQNVMPSNFVPATDGNYFVMCRKIPGTQGPDYYEANSPELPTNGEFLCEIFCDEDGDWWFRIKDGICVCAETVTFVAGTGWLPIADRKYYIRISITASNNLGNVTPVITSAVLEDSAGWPTDCLVGTGDGTVDQIVRIAQVFADHHIEQCHLGAAEVYGGACANTMEDLAMCKDTADLETKFLSWKATGSLEECKVRKLVRTVKHGYVTKDFIDIPGSDVFVNHTSGLDTFGEVDASLSGNTLTITQKKSKNHWQCGVWIKELAQSDKTITIGLQGIQGSQGFQGPRGFQGVQGLRGFQGVQGAQGVRGFQGTQGIRGFQGFVGAQGIQGNGTQGVQGPTSSVTGIQGNYVIQVDTLFSGGILTKGLQTFTYTNGVVTAIGARTYVNVFTAATFTCP